MSISSGWCIEGTREALDALFKDGATPEDKEVLLFSNDVDVADDSVNADFTEITTNGGEKKTLTRASFAAATDADPSVSRWNDTTGAVWNITGPLTIYGYAVRGVTSQKIYYAKNLGVNTLGDGNTYTIQPFDLIFDIPEAA